MTVLLTGSEMNKFKFKSHLSVTTEKGVMKSLPGAHQSCFITPQLPREEKIQEKAQEFG